MVKLKRAYDEPAASDGERYLVDRLWPRGISKEALQLTDWLKGLAPSDDLRTWFNHDPKRWAEFCERYVAELEKSENLDLLEKLAARAQEAAITLVYAAKDQEHNNAVVLQKLIEKRLRKIMNIQENRENLGEPWETAAPSWDWLCRQIVMEAGEAIIFADRANVIRLWNRGAERIFGYTAEEALGQSLNLIIPERWRDRHWESYRRVMASGATKYGQGQLLAVPGQRRDGAPLSLEFSLVLIKDTHGRILGAAAVLRDVTAKWQEMKALKKRLADLEQKTSV